MGREEHMAKHSALYPGKSILCAESWCHQQTYGAEAEEAHEDAGSELVVAVPTNWLSLQ